MYFCHVLPLTFDLAWSPYAVAGVLQGTLLVMCLLWKSRQHKLGIDDFGNPLISVEPQLQESPIPVTRVPSDGERVQDAVSAAVESDVREEPEDTSGDHGERADEETPLLKRNASESQGRSWFGWLRR